MAINVRARDLRSNIKTHGFEQGVVYTLEAFLDEYASMRQHMRELTQIVAQCIDKMEQFVVVGDGLKNEIERIKRERKPDDEGATG